AEAFAALENVDEEALPVPRALTLTPVAGGDNVTARMAAVVDPDGTVAGYALSFDAGAPPPLQRSEERRVGKEGRSRRAQCQAEDGIRDFHVTGVQTCALPICRGICRARKRG